MKLKIYLLRIAVGAAAFVLGVGLYGASRYLKSYFQTKKPEVVAAATAPIKESVCAPSLFAPAQPEPVAEPEKASEWTFDGSGEYFIADKLPKEFKDFAILSIIARDYDKTTDENPYGVPIAPEGFVETARKHKFTRISIGNKQLSFETEAKNGISYKFTGTFLDWEYDEKLDVSVVLEGRLTKMRGGKKIASMKVHFGLDESCGC